MTPAEFKTARSQLGLSLTGMAQLLRVNRSTIIRWEQGHVPIPGLAAVAVEFKRELDERKEQLSNYRANESWL